MEVHKHIKGVALPSTMMPLRTDDGAATFGPIAPTHMPIWFRNETALGPEGVCVRALSLATGRDHMRACACANVRT